MITKEEYKQISSEWEGDIYQKWKRIKVRLKFFCTFVDIFKDRNVVELGSNAGLYGYEIAKVARSYVGVEIGETFYKQSLITKKYIKNSNVAFCNLSAEIFLHFNKSVEALFICFTLYHLSDKEIEMLKEILPNCRIVFIQTRSRKRRSEKNSYKLWKPNNVNKFLKEAGFTTKTYWHKSEKFFETIGIK